MSREVNGTGDDGERRPSPLAALPGRLLHGPPSGPRGRLLTGAGVLAGTAAVAVLALQPFGAAPADADRDAAPTAPPSTTPAAPSGPATPSADRLPAAEGLTATLVAAGRDGADLTSLDVRVAVDNARAAALEVTGVQVVGLGTTIVDAGDGVVVPAGDRTYLRARVTPDCAVLRRGRVRVLVSQRRGDGGGVVERVDVPASALDVLDPLCPPVEPGLRVAVTATRETEGGTAVRVVNHGTRSALVTPRAAPDAGQARLESDPPLPYDLAPGEALVATLRVVGGCPDAAPERAAEALFLEAEAPDGFSAVTGFPTAAVRTALERRGPDLGCPSSR